jgi:uncharacterized membrane protein YgcG
MRPPHHPPVGRLAAVLAAAAALLLVAPVALAFTLPPSEPGRSVYDFAGIWRADTIAGAEATAARLRSSTGVEMAIVSIPTGADSVSTGIALADAKAIMDAWGVGKQGVNNGIVVLFDLDTTLHHGQIYVYGGSGVTSTYLSADAAQAVANDMIGKAKQGDLDGALATGMAEIADAVDHPGTRLGSALPLSPLGILALLVDAGIVVFMLATWWRDGRDPPIPTIDDSVMLPAPPPGMTPSMAALLRDGVANKSAPAAALVDLASRNLLAMREGSTFLGIGHKPLDFIVSDPSDPRVAHAETLVGEPERGLLRELRAIADGGVVKHTDLPRAPQMQAHFASALGAAAAATPWFRSDPTRSVTRLGYVPFASLLVMFGIVFLGELDGVTAVTLVVATFITIGIGSVLARAMAARTQQGSWALGMALAYRNTIAHEIGAADGIVRATEATKLKLPWLTTPDALIVWAVALGLADEVGKLIARSMDDPTSASWHPGWYTGSGVSFASFGASMSSITTTAASSTGGGYGGGSSGGGGGGGGGF